MASSSSPCTFGFSSATGSPTARSSCILPGIFKTKDNDSLYTSLLGGCISRSQMRKILKKYHQNALQPLAQTVWPSRKRIKRSQVMALSAPLEEGISCHDTPHAKQHGVALEEARKMLDASFDCTTTDRDVVQSLHKTARMFQMAIEKQRALTKGPWFAKAWLGIDHNAWIKSIAYQAAVHAFIQSALNIARTREDKNVAACAAMEESLMRLCNPLEDSIRQQLSSRDPDAEEWLWNQQHPVAVANISSILEKDPCFNTLAILDRAVASQHFNKELDTAILVLALSVCATIMKLGAAKLSCSDFSKKLAEETGHLMDVLAEFSSIEHVYSFSISYGLKSEFLMYFGPRAASLKGDSNLKEGERTFWVELVQKLLKGALSREGVRQKLSSVANLEVLEQDLAVFGFFAALGRRTRSFLAMQKVDLDDSTQGLLRFLEGGSVLYYPQLATLTTYQLFVEVVSEELAWIPFFKDFCSSSPVWGRMKNEQREVDQLISREEEGEALAAVFNVCSYWVDDFMNHSKWIQQAKTGVAASFLRKIQSRVCDCIAATSCIHQQNSSNKIVISKAAVEVEETLKRLLYEDLNYKPVGGSGGDLHKPWTWEIGMENLQDTEEQVDLFQLEQQLKAFDKDLQRVEEVLSKLEELLKDSELSKFQNGRVQLTAININLQKIRRLKKEAQAIETSLKQKAFSKDPEISKVESQFPLESFEGVSEDNETDLLEQRSRVNLAFDDAKDMAREFAKKLSFLPSATENLIQKRDPSANDDDAFDRAAAAALDQASIPTEVAQFEALRQELLQLDSHIRACAGEASSESGEDAIRSLSHIDKTAEEKGKIWDFVSKSSKKFKNASLDVLKGTQILATDVVVAVTLLKSSLSGHELTEREKKTLRRTCTDLASVIPIGFLMLLPVTAVGHAAMLAAIQKYIPALIPSAYAPERLELLKQLEQLRKMGVEAARGEVNSLPTSLDSKD